MIRLPQKQSLVAQTYAILKEQIESGAWARWLPSESELCEQLKVSRRTVRSALAQLEREGLLKGGQGRRRLVSGPSKKVLPPTSGNAVVVLTSHPLSGQSSFATSFMDDLREHLSAAGYHLEIHVHAGRHARQPGPELERLVRRTRAAGWMLWSQTGPVQRWFSQRALPCVIIGSRHEGVALPSVDIDFRALSRHAAGLLLAKGYTRLALMNHESGMAGDLESERGFKEAVARFQRGGEAIIEHHDGTTQGVCERVQVLLRRLSPRMGFLISGTTCVLTTLCFLLRRGLRVPQDVALISLEDDLILQHAIPSIAHYSANPKVLSHKISRAFLQVVRFGVSEPRDYRIMPRFVPGESLE